jgi:uncharacterized coiled-coil DUF342 family protein
VQVHDIHENVDKLKQTIDELAGNATGNHEMATKAYESAETILNQAV